MVVKLQGWSGAAKQVCDYFGGPLVAALGELLQPFSILVLDADDDCQLSLRVADMGVNVARVDRG